MADDDIEQPENPQPLASLSEWIMKKVQDAVERAEAVKGTGMDVDPAAPLPPSHSPTHRDAGDGQPSGWVRGRSLAEDWPPSITETILSNAQAFLPEQGPELGQTMGQDSGPFGIAPDQSICESILNDPGRYQPDSGPEPDRDKGPDR